ncbi:putative LRR receptor-like serine/threonine-protein kinase [Cocos nucifera]|uniref:non-specific serine/threonine protein kinase n=1 Tax=Cocos nucifera TaxID=13894 RepID=A0A8K0HX99_COCNU|nr:putative LRR receptor-like serine/threonine-protein kinase [Cocos nucifera]
MFDESQTEESDSKAQRIKEFQAEALLLSRVHHRNLVSLIGYCKDDNCLALVYEFAAQGSLKDHLTDKDGTSKVLNWRERLQIAIDAATGLEYLHKGCTPPIIHRDVKPNNILLSQNFVAKIADFGVSKAFLADDHTHISTKVIAGTPGYMDPEAKGASWANAGVRREVAKGTVASPSKNLILSPSKRREGGYGDIDHLRDVIAIIVDPGLNPTATLEIEGVDVGLNPATAFKIEGGMGAFANVVGGGDRCIGFDVVDVDPDMVVIDVAELPS